MPLIELWKRGVKITLSIFQTILKRVNLLHKECFVQTGVATTVRMSKMIFLSLYYSMEMKVLNSKITRLVFKVTMFVKGRVCCFFSSILLTPQMTTNYSLILSWSTGLNIYGLFACVKV